MVLFILISTLLCIGSTKAQDSIEVLLDSDASYVHWKGTKMRGMGKHEGEVKIKSGFIQLIEGDFYNGEVTIDMTSINVTDMPDHEVIPRTRLNNHLKSEDFFAVKDYPEAKFKVSKILKRARDRIIVEGELTIRDVTDKIRVPLKLVRSSSEIKAITTTFKFDRFNWNVGYTGSWLERTLVDKEVELRIFLSIRE